MSQNTSHNPISIPENGKLFVPLTNDYLFRALLIKNNYVLKGLLCALLHLNESDVTSVIVTNTVQPGESIDDKAYVLDINVMLNQTRIINIEMQVVNLKNWPERSLCYLSRNLNQLKQGEDYIELRPVIQIGLLDYTLFPKRPEFYATYRLLNEKTHTPYSDKLQLSVLDLTRIDLATEEDKAYQIEYWASLFKATTWEELKMLAQNNDYFKEAAETVYLLAQDEEVRLRCQAREDYYRNINGMNRMIRERDEKISEQDAKISEQQALLSKKDQQLFEKDALIATLQAQLAQKQN